MNAAKEPKPPSREPRARAARGTAGPGSPDDRSAASSGRRRAWRTASLALPLFLSLGSLGFVYGEAGILRARSGAEIRLPATRSDMALRRLQVERRQRVRGLAERFGVTTELGARIYDAAVNEGVDAELAFRLVRVESRFRGGAIGPAGSIGYTQVQPRTARWLDPSVTDEDLLEVETNLRLGFRYLRMLLDRYGDLRIALLAYNRGPGTVEALLEVGEDPANGYAARVLGTGGAATR